ncbi:MAG: hypothetical protein OEY89_15570 [Gammaproteobacteria bacterium]|nr:hypothetical protein [Gammaproteobacteria bacterium]
MDIENTKDKQLKCSISLSPAEPLWQRVPTHNAEGRMLGDLMILIPKLKEKPQKIIQNIIRELEIALHYHQENIVFADLNINLNLLWVSVQPVPGIRIRIAESVSERVPEAKLVSHC